jgi:TPP-dependent trihydroxycyclohexane-1,2-dione (THcHDO) dehydratase
LWIKAYQKLHSQGKYFSVDFTPGQPALVAEGFGLKALEVKTPAELDATMDKAFDSTAPLFLDVIAQPEVDLLPPVTSWLKAAEKASDRKALFNSADQVFRFPQCSMGRFQRNSRESYFIAWFDLAQQRQIG